MAMPAPLQELQIRLMHNDPALPELRLAYSHVGDFGASAIGRALTTNSVLQKLTLASAQIGRLGIEELCKGVAHNKGIQVMTLYGNGLMDEGGTALGRVLLTNRTLTKLDLDDAGIGPRGCAELCKGLAKNRVLQELNLQENRLGDEGFTALGNALTANTTLQQLALGGNQNHTDVGLIYLAHGIRRAAKRAAPLNLTGVELAKVADIIGMEKTAGGWNSIKMLQAFHDGAGARPTENREAGSAVLATAMLKPVSWTSSSVTLTTEQSAPAGSLLKTEETYLVLVTIFDDWGEAVTSAEHKAAACKVLTLARPQSVASPQGTDKLEFLPLDRPGQVGCKFQILSAAKGVELKVLVGASAEHVVGGQTLTFDAEEPSRVPHSFKMLWGVGQAQPAKWVPGIFPGDPWEIAFKVLDETGRELGCAPPQIKLSLQPQRRGVGLPLLQIRATPQQAQSETEEAKRRRTSYSSLPTSFIASLVLPAPANMRGVYHLECEVKHGDMEIQLQLPEIGFEAMPSRVPLEWSPLDVVYFLRSQRLPIDPAAEQLSNHEGTAVDGPMLVRDGPELLLTWVAIFDPETRAAVKTALYTVADLQARAASLGAPSHAQLPQHQPVFAQQVMQWPPPSWQ